MYGIAEPGKYKVYGATSDKDDDGQQEGPFGMTVMFGVISYRADQYCNEGQRKGNELFCCEYISGSMIKKIGIEYEAYGMMRLKKRQHLIQQCIWPLN